MYASLSANKAEPILALKPRGEVTRNPQQGYQWPHKRTIVRQKFKKDMSFHPETQQALAGFETQLGC